MSEDEAREALATVMLQHSIPTGHGDTIFDLIAELNGWLEDHPPLPLRS